ncbi:NUDIX domain-containing protein [Corynebacterium sp. CCM 8835]|uniref:NUDIX domain-containing protein n=1 Tax=Corynebacterium antarcticum TaxID=2800405 RepID=A0ABS1FLL8_9CORY|nr:NUDIX domain-containing protein [Corynebacterium antarcticum]MCK7660622.1 NUDIX domain-containing protein [Corynebacterium antarcticum]MCL0245368.1 NUDIX domain-containing protein [Corynebacterium antarcticum]MCX7539938.1 NUDIX domain-containing protein [Corynebacterium antarcticum]
MPTPDFILDLRERISHAPLWLPGVTAVVLRPAADPGQPPEVLLVRRADTGAWTPVTGIAEPGEQPDVTAVREITEETGVEAEVERVLWVRAVGPVTYPNGDVASYMDTALLCRVVGDSGCAHAADDENTDARWFPVDRLPELSERFRQTITAALAGGPTRVGTPPDSSA